MIPVQTIGILRNVETLSRQSFALKDAKQSAKSLLHEETDIEQVQSITAGFSLGWGQIDEHCWSKMTSQLIIQCCRGWPNCPTCGVQQCVIMCVEQC